MAHKVTRMVAEGIAVMALVLTGVALYGCGGNADEPAAVEEQQGDDMTEDTEPAVTTDDEGEYEETVVPFLEPTLDKLPTNRTADEIEQAVDDYVRLSFPDREMTGKELKGEVTNGTSDMWATYVIHFKEGDDIGVEVTCTSIASPTVTQQRYLRAANGLYYDVETKQNLNDIEAFGQASPDEISGSDQEEGVTVQATESRDKKPVLVKDDDGRDVWVVVDEGREL